MASFVVNVLKGGCNMGQLEILKIMKQNKNKKFVTEDFMQILDATRGTTNKALRNLRCNGFVKFDTYKKKGKYCSIDRFRYWCGN